MTKEFQDNKAIGFTDHSNLPKGDEQAKSWQSANKSWWEKNPMRYDFSEEINIKEFSKEFYNEIDSRFFRQVWEFMPWEKIPFDNLINFEAIAKQNVLEIGVGNGSHAKILSKHAKNYTGIDLTNYAVKSTKKRLKLFGLNGLVKKMDAEKLEFEDNSFDFVWSWGVIHHTSNTQNVLNEINRVLRPNGKIITMVYHLSPWHYYIRTIIGFGILKGDLFRGKSPDKILQDRTDGALARFYSVKEWSSIISKQFNIIKNSIYGTKHQLIPISDSKLKRFLVSLIPNKLGRFIANRPLIGWFLVSVFEKK